MATRVETQVGVGHAYPLGAHVVEGGVNFSIFSKAATQVELLLFDDVDAPPSRVIRLDPTRNRTFYYWHVFVPGVGAGQLYGYRVFGPYEPDWGHRFDPSKLLLDPYTRGVMYSDRYDRHAAERFGEDNVDRAMKGVVVDTSDYLWDGDEPLQIPFREMVIYEAHVAGMTKHPSSGVRPSRRGTYVGLIEKIPYLKELGVNAIELLPVQQFDPQEAPDGLTNYWGYVPIAFFAPHRGYSSRRDPLGPVDEFRDMVKAMHRAGIEVILDVVFNHTAEGNHQGPTLSFRGLSNRAYYILEANRARYTNYSGTGNTFKCNHSIVRRLIMDALRYWVQEMHVDGFRFDLASILSRDEFGHPIENPPILWEIESDPVLAGTKIIAEAWDAAGLYQVGSFIGHRWAEWNGKFRDDIRRYVKGDEGMVPVLAHRVAGSRDLYPGEDRRPSRGVNFITAHDGFTLADLVAYNEKHNEANLEDNRDGNNTNFSWNCGIEGPTDDPEILALRDRQMKNLLTLLLVSQGTPMILMGDEVGRTQQGNNNVYCQDNELAWFDWRQVEENAGLLRFVRGLIAFRKSFGLFSQPRFWGEKVDGRHARITWHGTELHAPDWGTDAHHLAWTLQLPEAAEQLHVMSNAYWEPQEFEIPGLADGRTWRRVVDTAREAPDDFHPLEEAPAVRKRSLELAPRSMVVLVAR